MTQKRYTEIPKRQKCINKEEPYIGGAKDIFDDELGKPQSQVNQEEIANLAAEVQRAQQAEGVIDGKVATEKQRAEGVEGGLDTRLQTVEELAEISVGGGDIGIGTAADFESDDPSDLAKVPTISAILGGANDGVYDISARHSGQTYADLEAALGVDGANIPSSLRRGGMSIKYVQTYDNKYVQYRLMNDSFNTTPANWQGVDDEPTAGSDNLVKSGGVYEEINQLGQGLQNTIKKTTTEKEEFINPASGWSSKKEFSVSNGQTGIIIVNGTGENRTFLQFFKEDSETVYQQQEFNGDGEYPFTAENEYKYIKLGTIGGISGTVSISFVTPTEFVEEHNEMKRDLTQIMPQVTENTEFINSIAYLSCEANRVVSGAGWGAKQVFEIPKVSAGKLKVTGTNGNGIIVGFLLGELANRYQETTFNEDGEIDFTPSLKYSYIQIGCTNFVGSSTVNVSFKTGSGIIDLPEIALQKENVSEPIISGTKVSVSGNNKSIEQGNINYTKEQVSGIWGGEYLSVWYNKLSGRNNVKIALDGDSITQEGYRNTTIDTIMQVGGYTSTDSDGVRSNLYTLFNNGLGGASAKEWVGTGEEYQFNGRTIPANGLLSLSMAENPNLLIIAWGINDAVLNEDTTTIEERVNIYLSRMRGGLQRIRTNTEVEGRSAYNRGINELSIILCSPLVSTTGGNREFNNWHQFIRTGLAELAREFGCAYIDFSMRTYGVDAYKYLNIWGDIGFSQASLHPSQSFTNYYASCLQGLIMPIGFWRYNETQSAGLLANAPKEKDIPVGYRYFCADTHKNIFCATQGEYTEATFTIGAISDVSSLSYGSFSIICGDTTITMMLLWPVYGEAQSSGNIANYLAKYISDALNAHGVVSHSNNNTFTLCSKTKTSFNNVSFVDGGVGDIYEHTNIPITAQITTQGSNNVFVDNDGNTVII